MDFKTLHLEEKVILPENHKEIVFDKNIHAVFDTKEWKTPEKEELQKKGFYGTRGADGKLSVYVNLDYKMTSPFRVRIFPNYEDENDRVLKYNLSFGMRIPALVPLYKYINKWGWQNRKESINLNYYLAEWLLENIGNYDDTDGLEVEACLDSDEIEFNVRNEMAFMRLLKDISAAFRILATKHAKTTFFSKFVKDNYNNYGYNVLLNRKEKELEDIDYADLVKNMLVPIMSKALQEGFEYFNKTFVKIDEGENPYEGEYAANVDKTIAISLNPKQKSMMFYRGDKCKGKEFFKFKMGAIVSRCISLATEKETYAEELAYWFKESAANLHYRYQRGISIKIPEAENLVIEGYE